jgi:PEP-CTERM motif
MVTAYGFKCNSPSSGSLCAAGSNMNQDDSGYATALYGFSGGGLGINSNTAYHREIPNTAFIQVDFSTVVSSLRASGATINDVVVTVSNINTGWNLYSGTTPGTLEGPGGQSLAPAGSPGFGKTTSTTITGSILTTLLTETYLGITAAVNCDVELSSIKFDYTPGNPVPEPGTYVLMGFALVGLGVAGKKLRRRV